MDYKTAEGHLFLCNCNNDASRVDPTYHFYGCTYREWYYNHENVDEEQTSEDVKNVDQVNP